jgi:peroxiredoxin
VVNSELTLSFHQETWQVVLRKGKGNMKKRYCVPACLSFLLVLIIFFIFHQNKEEGFSPAIGSGEGQKTERHALKNETDERSNPVVHTATKVSQEDPKHDRLFEEMGITRISSSVVPPDIELKDLNGATTKSSDFRGKIVFLNFWTTWCPSCRYEMPSLEKLHTKFKERDFVVVAIDIQAPAHSVKEFFKEYKLTFIALLDSQGKAADLFGIGSIPTTFILDKRGRIIGGAVGARKWDSKESEALFDYLVSQETVPSA